jgi:hypothetical protein
MPLEKAKAICKTLVKVFGNNAVDIQGGEPTIYPEIMPLIEYCNEIGLYPTLITNGIVLDRKDRVLAFKKAGVRDFLISVHGLGAVHDAVVGMEGAHRRQMKALRNLAEAGVPFRFNIVMTKATVLHLPQLATLGVRAGARVLNFLTFSPFSDQLYAGVRTVNNMPRHAELREPLVAALDILAEAGVEANVRFLPFCILPDRHRKSMYNFAQIPYDLHDWDHASARWVFERAQRIAEGEINPPIRRLASVRGGWLRILLRRLLPGSSDVVAMSARRERLFGFLRRLTSRSSRAARLLARLEAISDWDWNKLYLDVITSARGVYGPGCLQCSAQGICDGLHSDYAKLFDVDEAQPIELGMKPIDPTFYIREQRKVVEREDESWAL